MTIASTLDQLGFRTAQGVVATGMHREVISGVGATRTLLPKESGSLCLLDKANGMTWTLPTPVLGMQFEFFSTVDVSGGTIKIVTAKPASEFLVGALLSYTIATASPAGFSANGTNIVSIAMQTGGTYGGLLGTRILLTAISTTKWAVAGQIVGSGTIVTPFATS